MKPYGNKCIVLIKKDYVKDKGKIVVNEDGTLRYELEQDGKVLSSNLDGIKKGMNVVIDLRAGLPYRKAETKKDVTVICEAEDIYAIL